jgi:hypothetical protein
MFPVLVAQACNPSYSEGRDQEDCQPGQIVHETLSQKYPSQKKGASGVAQGEGSEFQAPVPHTHTHTPKLC